MPTSTQNFQPLMGLTHGTLSDSELNKQLGVAWEQYKNTQVNLSKIDNPFIIVSRAALTGTKKVTYSINISVNFLKFIKATFSMTGEESIAYAEGTVVKSIEIMAENCPDENVGKPTKIKKDALLHDVD